MTGHITLVLGGARGGKSAWAERRASTSGRAVLYLATATAGDEEMVGRIAAHQAQRPASWCTVEAPVRLLQAVRDSAAPGDTVVVDCLTLWVSNVMLHMLGPDADPDSAVPAIWADIEAFAIQDMDALVALARDRDQTLIVVSNEVGMGVVPATPLGRHYRDILGRVNQAVASKADSVIMMIAGLPVDLRKLTVDQ